MRWVGFVFVLVLAVAAFAAPVNITSITAGTSRTLTNSGAAGTVAAWGGNVTPVDVVINSSTMHWQGFYGNVTGSLGLGGGASLLKTWTLSTLRGQVYASTGSNIDFTVLNSTAVPLANLDSAFSFLSAAADSAANSGSNNANTQFNISNYNVAASSKPRIMTMNGTGDLAWETVVLNANSVGTTTAYVFTGLINNSGKAFDNTAANFQIMVPVNGAGGSPAVNYYFYGEVQ